MQFCANDPEALLAAAKKVEHRCDAVDINLCVSNPLLDQYTLYTDYLVDVRRVSLDVATMGRSFKMTGN